MKSRAIRTFRLDVGKRSTHWVSVVVYKTRKHMRGILTVRHGHKSSSTTEACCWQANNPSKDGCVAEIHLALDNLNEDSIIHECTHAAFHRAILLGIPYEDKDFQEWVARNTGEFASKLLALFRQTKIKMKQ